MMGHDGSSAFTRLEVFLLVKRVKLGQSGVFVLENTGLTFGIL